MQKSAKQSQPQRSSGRQRSQRKDAEAKLLEDKAKGHLRKNVEPQQPEYEPAHAKDPKYTEENRGHQKGYGKNQRDEGLARHTRLGTRSIGASHG